MKTLFLSLLTLIIVTTSCDTMIPEVDTTPPHFLFEIQGDGFSRTFKSEDGDFRSTIQLNLKANTTYRYTFSGGDSGGTKLMQWKLGEDEIVNFTPEIPAPWTVSTTSSPSPTIPTSRIIKWRGDRSNPVTGYLLSGRFTTISIGMTTPTIPTSFKFLIRDFGGRAGTSNDTRGQINIQIGNHPTEITR